MDNKELLKKYWFPGLIAILLFVFVIVFAVNSASNREVVKEPHQVDGNYIIYSINGENYTADELYEDLKPVYSLNTAYTEFEKMVCDAAIKTTSDMQTLATNNAQYVLSTNDKAQLEAQMNALGFDGIEGLDDYFLFILKSQQLRTDYLKAHEEDIVKPFMEKNDPKYISHILVRVADVKKTTNEDGTYTLEANPTAEETAKVEAIKEALKTQSFAEVAKQYSDDGSAQNGGLLGYFDNTNQQFVKEFADASRALKAGEVSDVVLSEFGYHFIMAESKELADLYLDPAFNDSIYKSEKSLYYKPLIEKAEELNIKVTDADVWADLQTAFGLNEGSEDKQ